MNKLYLIGIICLFNALVLIGCDKDSKGLPQISMRPGIPNQPITTHFWILAIGQSNMWGQGMMTDPFPKDSHIDMINSDRLGPSYAFAMEFIVRHPQTEVHIIQCAVRGSPSIDWIGGGIDFNSCIGYWRGVGSPDISLILGMQGENEGVSGDMNLASTWTGNFTNTVQSFRSVLNKQVPIIFAQIGPNPGNPNTGPSPDYRTWQKVQDEQARINLPNVSMITTQDLPLEDGWVHFTKEAYMSIGERMLNVYSN